jgi:hypothetical protein
MDWINKSIHTLMKSQTINLKDLNHWKHPQGNSIDRFKIHIDNKKIGVELDTLKNSAAIVQY